MKAKSFFDDYYIKENDVYTYIFYMPFANFYLMDYINFQATSNLMKALGLKWFVWIIVLSLLGSIWMMKWRSLVLVLISIIRQKT